MLDSADHARAWMLKGDSDLLTVRHLLDTNGPYDTACFHAQQAAEKYLKALLAMTGRPIPMMVTALGSVSRSVRGTIAR
jgi:HEPN domain-containing protein